jgi:hypothetical protein
MFCSSLAPVHISPKFFRREIPETLSANWGAESDYLASGRTRTYNPSVNRRMLSFPIFFKE